MTDPVNAADAVKCRVPGCGAAFTEPDPDKRAMRMRHHLGNHYASGNYPDLAGFAPPYTTKEADGD